MSKIIWMLTAMLVIMGCSTPVSDPKESRSSEKAITSFQLAALAVSGSINEAAHSVLLTVPVGTNVTALTPTIVHTGASISPKSGVAQDFSKPVMYTVTAEDGSSQAYTVTVVSSAKAITSFRLDSLSVSGVIDQAGHTISLSVPVGTDVRALTPTIFHTGASISPSSGAAQDFSSPVIYTVTASDGSTQAYTVTVGTSVKAITSFEFASLSVTGSINEFSHTIAVTVPFGTDLTALTPNIVHTGAGISPSSGMAQDFSSPVRYTVTATDGTTQIYTVTVTTAKNPAKAITSFRFESLSVTGTIDEPSHTITVTVPFGTSRTALVPTIVHTGVRVSPNSGSVRDFTNPVNYTVTAEDQTEQVYTVTVSMPYTGFALYKFPYSFGSTYVKAFAVGGGKIYCATYSTGMFVSSDGGASFSKFGWNGTVYSIVQRGSVLYLGTSGTGLKKMSTVDGSISSIDTGAIDSRNINRVAIVDSKLYLAVGYAGRGRLLVSPDDGATWTNHEAGGLGSGVYDVFIEGSTICAATYEGLALSHDGGATWQTFTTANGLANNHVRGVSYASGTIYAATDGGLSVSSNGGASWTNYTEANGLRSSYIQCVLVSGSTVYLGTSAGLSISRDAGATWRSYLVPGDSNLTTVNEVQVIDGKIMMAANSGFVYGVGPLPE